MSVFFNGRLWVSPATVSVVDDSAMYNQNLSVGNVVALVGKSTGGKPNSPLVFGSPSDAQAALKSGELLTAVLKAFDPSNQTGSPASVVAVRVNPALQASLALLDTSSTAVINLKSTDYGLYTNQIAVKVEAASTIGRKVTVQLGNNYFTADNIARNAFSLLYSGGQASATATVNGTTLTLSAPAGTPVAVIDLATYPTIQQLSDRINVVAGFASVVQDGNGQKPSLQGLDFVTAQDVKTAAFTVTGHLQAVVDWISGTGEGYLDATRPLNVGTLPAVIPFTYLVGGSDGITTTNEWAAAYTTLQTVDVQWVTPVSSDPAIHAMNDAHCQFMSMVGRMERRGIVGMASGTTDVQAIAAAKALNSDRTGLVHLGFYDYDATGALVLMPPYILAAAIAGAFAGVNPGTPLTNKTLTLRGIERNLRNPTDTDALINGGVLCVENTQQGYKVVKSISTWLADTKYNRVELSVGVALDFVSRNVRNALDVLRGQKANQVTLSRAISITESTLRQLAVPDPVGPGVLAGDAKSPPYKGIVASLSGDVLNVQFQCSPVLPLNYTLISIFAVPFSGSASAS